MIGNRSALKIYSDQNVGIDYLVSVRGADGCLVASFSPLHYRYNTAQPTSITAGLWILTWTYVLYFLVALHHVVTIIQGVHRPMSTINMCLVSFWSTTVRV